MGTTSGLSTSRLTIDVDWTSHTSALIQGQLKSTSLLGMNSDFAFGYERKINESSCLESWLCSGLMLTSPRAINTNLQRSVSIEVEVALWERNHYSRFFEFAINRLMQGTYRGQAEVHAPEVGAQ